MRLYIEKTTRENQSADGIKLAKRVLSLLSGQNADQIRIERDPFGKPYAMDGTAHFNISHSHDYVVCAVSDTPVGVDIEYIQPVKEGVMKRFFTPAERRYILAGSDDAEQNLRFYELWTLKEAYTKAVGKGLPLLHRVELSIDNGCITANNDFNYMLDYSVAGFVIAVCY